MAYLSASNLIVTDLTIVPPGWPKHEKVYRVDGFTKTGRYLCRLPVDFYLHQIAKKKEQLINGDNRTLNEFCSQWGALEHPFRYSKAPHPFYLDSDSAKRRQRALEAIEETDEMRKKRDDDSFISLSECKLAIEDLADAINWLNECLLGKTESLTDKKGNPTRAFTPAHVINAGTITHGVIAGPGIAIIGKHRCNLTNAICNQVVDTFAEDSDWHKCKWCGCPYKHFRRGPEDYGTDRRKCTSQYCSKACSDAASKSARSKPRNTH